MLQDLYLPTSSTTVAWSKTKWRELTQLLDPLFPIPYPRDHSDVQSDSRIDYPYRESTFACSSCSPFLLLLSGPPGCGKLTALTAYLTEIHSAKNLNVLVPVKKAATDFRTNGFQRASKVRVFHTCEHSVSEYSDILSDFLMGCTAAANMSLTVDIPFHDDVTRQVTIIKFYGEAAHHRMMRLTAAFVEQYQMVVDQAFPSMGTAAHMRGLVYFLQTHFIFFVHTSHDTHSVKVDRHNAFPPSMTRCPVLRIMNCTRLTPINIMKRLYDILEEELARRHGLSFSSSPDFSHGKAISKRQQLQSSRSKKQYIHRYLIAEEALQQLVQGCAGDIRHALNQLQWILLIPPGITPCVDLRPSPYDTSGKGDGGGGHPHGRDVDSSRSAEIHEKDLGMTSFSPLVGEEVWKRIQRRPNSLFALPSSSSHISATPLDRHVLWSMISSVEEEEDLVFEREEDKNKELAGWILEEVFRSTASVIDESPGNRSKTPPHHAALPSEPLPSVPERSPPAEKRIASVSLRGGDDDGDDDDDGGDVLIKVEGDTSDHLRCATSGTTIKMDSQRKRPRESTPPYEENSTSLTNLPQPNKSVPHDAHSISTPVEVIDVDIESSSNEDNKEMEEEEEEREKDPERTFFESNDRLRKCDNKGVTPITTVMREAHEAVHPCERECGTSAVLHNVCFQKKPSLSPAADRSETPSASPSPSYDSAFPSAARLASSSSTSRKRSRSILEMMAMPLNRPTSPSASLIHGHTSGGMNVDSLAARQSGVKSAERNRNLIYRNEGGARSSGSGGGTVAVASRHHHEVNKGKVWSASSTDRSGAKDAWNTSMVRGIHAMRERVASRVPIVGRRRGQQNSGDESFLNEEELPSLKPSQACESSKFSTEESSPHHQSIQVGKGGRDKLLSPSRSSAIPTSSRDEAVDLFHSTARLLTQKYTLSDVLSTLNVPSRKLMDYLFHNMYSYFQNNQMAEYAACVATASEVDTFRATMDWRENTRGTQYVGSSSSSSSSGNAHHGIQSRTNDDDGDMRGMLGWHLSQLALVILDTSYRVYHPNVYVPRSFVSQQPPPFIMAAYPRVREWYRPPRGLEVSSTKGGRTRVEMPPFSREDSFSFQTSRYEMHGMGAGTQTWASGKAVGTFLSPAKDRPLLYSSSPISWSEEEWEQSFLCRWQDEMPSLSNASAGRTLFQRSREYEEGYSGVRNDPISTGNTPPSMNAVAWVSPSVTDVVREGLPELLLRTSSTSDILSDYLPLARCIMLTTPDVPPNSNKETSSSNGCSGKRTVFALRKGNTDGDVVDSSSGKGNRYNGDGSLAQPPFSLAQPTTVSRPRRTTFTFRTQTTGSSDLLPAPPIEKEPRMSCTTPFNIATRTGATRSVCRDRPPRIGLTPLQLSILRLGNHERERPLREDRYYVINSEVEDRSQRRRVGSHSTLIHIKNDMKALREEEELMMAMDCNPDQVEIEESFSDND